MREKKKKKGRNGQMDQREHERECGRGKRVRANEILSKKSPTRQLNSYLNST